MKEINVTVRDKVAKSVGNAVCVCGNSDYVINFTFDEEWAAFEVKTARFKHGSEYTDVVFSGTVCPVPIITNVDTFSVGVFAGNLQTTTPAYVFAKKSILCGSGVPSEPTPDVYSQIMTAVNTAVDTAKSVEQKAENGEFNGKDYVLTKEDKDEIVKETIEAVEGEIGGGGIVVDEIIEDETIEIPLGGIADADKTDIVQEVLSEIDVIVGSVDAENDIVLNKNVTYGRTYNLKFIDTTGKLTDICTVTIPAQG